MPFIPEIIFEITFQLLYTLYILVETPCPTVHS